MRPHLRGAFRTHIGGAPRRSPGVEDVAQIAPRVIEEAPQVGHGLEVLPRRFSNAVPVELEQSRTRDRRNHRRVRRDEDLGARPLRHGGQLGDQVQLRLEGHRLVPSSATKDSPWDR